jgi:hypothetical protein
VKARRIDGTTACRVSIGGVRTDQLIWGLQQIALEIMYRTDL